MRKTAGRWTLVHQGRWNWRGYKGVFLGTDGAGGWVAGRQYDGTSMDDGFAEDGEWWHASYFDISGTETERWQEAQERYLELAEAAEYPYSPTMLRQRVGEAIDRNLSERVTPHDAYDLSAGWGRPERMALEPPGGHTYLLPFHEAKYRLLQYLRMTRASMKLDLPLWAGKPGLHEAYETVINATGPVRVMCGYNFYALSADGNYNDSDWDMWQGRTRNPHPDRGIRTL